MIKTKVSHLFPIFLPFNFVCDFPFIQGTWQMSFPLNVIPLRMNQSNSSIEPYSSSQPEVEKERLTLYMKSGRGSCALHEISKGGLHSTWNQAGKSCTLHEQRQERYALYMKSAKICNLHEIRQGRNALYMKSGRDLFIIFISLFILG